MLKEENTLRVLRLEFGVVSVLQNTWLQWGAREIERMINLRALIFFLITNSPFLVVEVRKMINIRALIFFQ
jgi:hypothetical protein